MSKTYAVIFSVPGQPDDYTHANVEASGPRDAIDSCYAAVEQEGGIWEGCQFTIWPIPVAN